MRRKPRLLGCPAIAVDDEIVGSPSDRPLEILGTGQASQKVMAGPPQASSLRGTSSAMAPATSEICDWFETIAFQPRRPIEVEMTVPMSQCNSVGRDIVDVAIRLRSYSHRRIIWYTSD